MKLRVSLGRFLILNVLTSCEAPAMKPVIHVPHGTPIVIDGRMDENEWNVSALQQLSDGTAFRLRHDGNHLFVGITARRQGFASVCIAQSDSIYVFHASAALGSVTYARSGPEWVTRDTEFTFGMRNPELSEQARAERIEYLSRHGWVASTFHMGAGLVQELQFSLTRFSRMTGLAIAFYIPSDGMGFVVTWPDSLASDDGCGDERLVRGYVPPQLRFDPGRWAELILEP